MAITTEPNGHEVIDLAARRDAQRAERQADRSFQVAIDSGDSIAALKNAHAHMIELFGALAADVSRNEMKRVFDSNEIRASLARLELKLGTRNANSITDEAGAAYIRAGATEIEARARTAIVAAEIKKFETEQRWASIKRVATILSPLVLAVIAILVSQINACSPILP